MATDKSLRQHYAMQGKVKNYLGKQKMVKAPEYWLSKPGHVKAKLAYITDAEEKILIDKNLYGSLRGRPNIGPAGLPSLQGGGGGSEGAGTGGGGGGGGGGGWSPGVAAEEKAQKAARDARDTAKEKAIETAAKTVKTKAPTKDRPTSFLGPEDLKQKKATVEDAREKAISEQYSTADTRAGVRTGDGYGMEEVYGAPEEFSDEELEKGITKKGLTIDYIGDTPVTNKRAREFNLGLKEKNIKTGEIQQGRNIINPYTQQLQSKFASIGEPKKGLWGTLGKVALGILAPQLLGPKLGQLWSGYNQAKNLSKFASNYTGKDYVGDFTSNLTSKSNVRDLLSRKTTTDTTDTRDDRVGQRDERDGRSQALQKIAAPKDVITESVQKFTPSKEQLTEVQKRRAILQEHAAKGALNERGQNTLLQMNQFLEKYLVSVAHGGRIDRPLMGRSRDI